MSAGGMEEFIESPMLLLQCGVALAVPAVLTAIVNLGCGKKRDQPVRPGGAKRDLSKTKPGVSSSAAKSGKSKRSTKSAASTKSAKGKGSTKERSTKDGKSKRSSKSAIDKSGKKSKKSSKGSSKSKKSKREVGKQQKTGPLSSQRGGSEAASLLKQPPSTRTAIAIEAEKRSANKAATHAAAVLANENSVKSAATQISSSQRSQQQQPGSGTGAYFDANANIVGTTALVAVGAGETTRDLKMEPAELRWSSAGGMQKISLLNQSNERQAIKVKCSDNNVYRVNPVYAIVEPGQTLNVDVMRQNGSNKVDKIVFVTTRAGLEENPKNLFKPGTQSSMMVLPLLATTTALAANAQPALTAAN